MCGCKWANYKVVKAFIPFDFFQMFEQNFINNFNLQNFIL